MNEIIDRETGEIRTATPRMPPEIAAAVLKVMKQVRQLGFDERNQHGNYGFVSIDKFLSEFRPLLAEAGLLLLIDEVDVQYREGAVNDRGRATQWAMPAYEIWLVHESGGMWGPLHRHLALPMTGPQTFGAAESYIQKRLLRGLFCVPTGDKDADVEEPGEMAADGAQRPVLTKFQTATKANPLVRPATPVRASEELARRIASQAPAEPARPPEPEIPAERAPEAKAAPEGINAALLAIAYDIAEEGTANLRIWWEGLQTETQHQLKTTLDKHLKPIAVKADAAFGTASPGDGGSPPPASEDGDDSFPTAPRPSPGDRRPRP